MMQITSLEFEQNVSAATRAADVGPVLITEQGRQAYVLLNYGEYRKLAIHQLSLAEALAQEGGDDIEFDPPRRGELFPDPPDFP
jgi:PHD/YefM family antitoxin component YafN of YafNO toxin-antitoxin module